MTDSALSLASAFLIGLLGGVHCIGMCGGIMHALSFALPEDRKRRYRMVTVLLYNLGRIGSYTLAGALVGSLGILLQGPLAILGPGLRIFAGLMMIAMGLYLAGWWRGLTQVERLGNVLIWRHLQPLTAKLMPVTRPWQALLLGTLWGWLPCGLTYSTLTLAGASYDGVRAALIMASFGLGTLPVLLLTGAFADKMRNWTQSATVRGAAGLLISGFGLWTLAPPVLHMLMG